MSLWNDLAGLVFDGVGQVGVKSRANGLYCPQLPEQFFSTVYLFFLSAPLWVYVYVLTEPWYIFN